jgi:ribonuclease P protein component
MLSPLNRLPKQNVAEVMRYGLRTTNEDLVLRYKKTSGPPRFTFIVSTKIDKRATQRNRIRRMLSESIRHVLPHLTGVDGVFVLRKNIAMLSQQKSEQIVVELLHKATLL